MELRIFLISVGVKDVLDRVAGLKEKKRLMVKKGVREEV